MKVIEPIGACVVAVSLVFDGQKHVEHASYHGEARATQPLGLCWKHGTDGTFPNHFA